LQLILGIEKIFSMAGPPGSFAVYRRESRPDVAKGRPPVPGFGRYEAKQ